MAESEAVATCTAEQTSKETTDTAESKQDKSKEDANVASPAKKKSDKVDILLKATADAPIMKKRKWAVDRTKKISSIIDFIRKYIKCEPAESLFLYVNQAFAPSPDQEIGNLFECYGSDGKLVLHYCKSEAWG